MGSAPRRGAAAAGAEHDARPALLPQLRHLAADHGPDAAHAAAVRQDARKVQEGPPRRHDRPVSERVSESSH